MINYKLIIFVIPLFFWNCNDEVKGLKNGDIIFQISKSAQSKAIQIATNSKWSHCGIIYIKNNKVYVYEASSKVKLSPFNRFVNKGVNKVFEIKRLKNSDSLLTKQALLKMKKIGDKFNNLPYDSYFEWGDQRIYCSELVWKIYKLALNIEVGKLEKLRDFNLDNKHVKLKLMERYGDNIPLDEITISPQSIYESEMLELVNL